MIIYSGAAVKRLQPLNCAAAQMKPNIRYVRLIYIKEADTVKKKRRIVCFLILAGAFVSAFMSGFSYQAGEAERGAEAFQMSRIGCDMKEENKFERAKEEPEKTAEESGGETGETSGGEKKTEKNLPEQAQIEDFGLILQMPELPTGCEITALTMMLNYYGYTVDKTVMASDYLPVRSAGLHYGADGRQYGNNMEQYFIGDPATENGYICGTGAIRTVADGYLSDCGSTLRAEDLTGTDVGELYRLLSEGTPVMVWVTIGMENRREIQGWYTEEGEFMDWSTNDHGAVLIGYSAGTVTIADPISGICEYSREKFEKVFASRGNQCVILKDNTYQPE